MVPPSGRLSNPHPMLFRTLVAAALGWAAAWLWGRGFDPREWLRGNSERVLSAAELSRYTGTEGSAGLYLAVLGRVFDVQRGRKHYGPGGAYSFFSGKDASRAFATGDFSPAGLVDDISGLSPAEMLTIENWLSFYTKNYVHIGKVSGPFYHKDGTPREMLRKAQALVEEGQKLQVQEESKKQRFPPCNSEWSSSRGSRVWCSKHSGGVERDWSGVPRRLHEPGSHRSRCVCVNTEGPSPRHAPPFLLESGRGDLDNPSLEGYEGCPPLSDWCALKD